jgi:hypothetical protein
MIRLSVIMVVDRDNEDTFWASFDEDAIAAALPADHAHLVTAMEPPGIEFYAEADAVDGFTRALDERALQATLPTGARLQSVHVRQL